MDDAPVAVAPFGPVPFRPVPITREAGGSRLRRLSASTALAAAIHVGFTALFLVLWRTMGGEVTAPEPATAQFIVLPPGEATPPPAAPAVSPAAPAPAPAKAPPPAPPPPPPAAGAPAVSPVPPDPAPPTPSGLDQALKPGLLEPPPEAKAAATQDTTNQAGNASMADTKATAGAAGAPSAPAAPEPAKPAAAPEVLTTAESATSVPAPAPGDDSPAPPTAGDPSQASKATAQLAAALPMSTMAMPLSFRAALAAQGTSSNAAYRGSVFGALQRAREGASEQAQARRLKGQVVLAIVLTATGAIETLSIIQSSGSDAADAFAIDMVKRAAPFPPPPPGASRTFTPAIAFGNG